MMVMVDVFNATFVKAFNPVISNLALIEALMPKAFKMKIFFDIQKHEIATEICWSCLHSLKLRPKTLMR